jgi:cytochrome c oxidase subunit 2
MLLRVYVDSRDDFDRWVRQQREPAREQSQVSEGQRVFQSTACINCHAVSGTVATGQFGPDLTHLMSRDTIGSGIVPNNAVNLRTWIQNPESLKPGSRMPSMQLTDPELDAITAYLVTLR